MGHEVEFLNGKPEAFDNVPLGGFGLAGEVGAKPSKAGYQV